MQYAVVIVHLLAQGHKGLMLTVIMFMSFLFLFHSELWALHLLSKKVQCQKFFIELSSSRDSFSFLSWWPLCFSAFWSGYECIPQTWLPIRCAAASIVCICRRSPLWSCRSWCCHPGTVTESAGFGFCRLRSATPDCSGGSRTSCRILRSNWAVSERGDTVLCTPALSQGLCWCTGRLRCTWWIEALCSLLGFVLQNKSGKYHEI